ncbi:MAG: radical SAM protein [Candidatus Heimdallarchaeota archaeon]
MIIFSKYLCGSGTVSEALRSMHTSSHEQSRDDLLRFSTNYRPIVVWNLTKHCNLRCSHCYIDAKEEASKMELSTEEGIAFLDDLAKLHVPLVLFSGGEPFLHRDFYVLLDHALKLGLRVAISTNGTLIDKETAASMAAKGVSYVGVSLDSNLPTTHDNFRGVSGAYERTLEGLKYCINAGLKTGVRITVTKDNYKDLPGLYELARDLKIPRFCVYYLVPTGRGQKLMDLDLDPEQRQEVFDFLCKATLEQGAKPEVEIVTTDGPFDGPLILEYLGKNHQLKGDIQTLMQLSGGCSAGEKIANVDPWGNVHPCQFWTHESLGNVRDQPFSQIWHQESHELLTKLRSKEEHLQGACGDCQYKVMCKGCRLRALFESGDIFATDPACPFNGHS